MIPLLAPEKLAGRLSALEAVWGLAPEAHEAVPALSRLIDCDQPHVAPIAAKVLGDIGSEAAVAIPILLGRLARKPPGHDKAARSAFCEAIGKMGPRAQSAIPRLLAELREAPLASSPGRELDRNDQRVVRTLLFALIRLGNADPAVLSEIRRHLANEDEHVQLSALRALARLTPDSTDVLASHWTWFCEHPGSRNRIGVILAIGRLAGDRPDAVAILTALLLDRDPEICKAAAWSLGKIGGAASEALPTLRELVKDSPDVLNSNYDRQPLRRSLLADSPRIQLERDRWIDREDPLFSGANDGLDWGRSLAEIAREAVAAIEAGSQESPPPAVPD